MIEYIKAYEATKPQQHPVGITAFDSGREGSMDVLFGSPADWISPQNDGASGDYRNDPPAADGRVELSAGTYRYEWFNPAKGESAGRGQVQAAGGSRQFKAPFAGDAVLYLKAQ